IAALNPQPPLAVIERQRKAMEDAIAVLRADYDQPVIEDDFDDIIASLDGSVPFETHTDDLEPVPEQPSPEPFAARPVPVAPEPPVEQRAAVPARTPPELDPVFGIPDGATEREHVAVANDDHVVLNE